MPSSEARPISRDSASARQTSDTGPRPVFAAGPQTAPQQQPGLKGKAPAPAQQAPRQQKPGAQHPGGDASPAAPPAAVKARVQKRHNMLALSFVMLVLLPLGTSIYYLYAIADDQYASKLGFAVRSEEINSAQDLLGGLSSSLSGSSSADTDILYAYIRSQDMVERVTVDLDLAAMYSRPEFDPVFAYQPTGEIEDLVAYWNRMVHIDYDGGTGLIEIRVNAFAADDAQAIASEIVEISTKVINDLSASARQDATRYAQEELDRAVERLKAAREALTEFRSRTRLADPTADIQGQMGLLNSLEGQLAEAQIDYNLLQESAQENDPRLEQGRRRIVVIERLIEQERAKFGINGNANSRGGDNYSTMLGEYESLSVDREYAEQVYVAAQNALDAAQAEAQRNSRYLAAFMPPTRADSARYPRRAVISAVTALFLVLAWAIGALIVYSLRDRR